MVRTKEKNKGKTKGKYNLREAQTSLLALTVLPLLLLRGHSFRSYAPDPGRAQKL